MTRSTRRAKRLVSIQRRVMVAICGKQAAGSPATYADVFRFVLPTYAASFRDVNRAIEALVGRGAIIRTLLDRRVFHLSIPTEGAAS